MDAEVLSGNAEQAERYLKVMANRNRLIILCLLSERSMTVGEINQVVSLSQSALSQHLAVLRDHGLVATARDAQRIEYSISDLRIEKLMQTMYEVFCGAN